MKNLNQKFHNKLITSKCNKAVNKKQLIKLKKNFKMINQQY